MLVLLVFFAYLCRNLPCFYSYYRHSFIYDFNYVTLLHRIYKSETTFILNKISLYPLYSYLVRTFLLRFLFLSPPLNSWYSGLYIAILFNLLIIHSILWILRMYVNNFVYVELVFSLFSCLRISCDYLTQLFKYKDSANSIKPDHYKN